MVGKLVGSVHNSRKTFSCRLAHMPGTQEGMHQKGFMANVYGYISVT